jgi:hypothetical protein
LNGPRNVFIKALDLYLGTKFVFHVFRYITRNLTSMHISLLASHISVIEMSETPIATQTHLPMYLKRMPLFDSTVDFHMIPWNSGPVKFYFLTKNVYLELYSRGITSISY